MTIAISNGWIGEGARTALAGVLSAGEARTLAAGPASALEAELERARDLREAAYAALSAHVERRPPPPPAAPPP